jgi:hypothetical protein
VNLLCSWSTREGADHDGKINQATASKVIVTVSIGRGKLLAGGEVWLALVMQGSSDEVEVDSCPRQVLNALPVGQIRSPQPRGPHQKREESCAIAMPS